MIAATTTGSARRTPHRLCAGLLVLGLILLAVGPARATDAYVQLKGRINPLYIANLELQYATMPGAIKEIIIVIPEQIKYERFALSQVRKIEFLQVMGEKKMSPVYKVRLHLKAPGHWREVFLMPLRELRGSSFGAPWTYPVDYDRGYDDNAEALQEIRIAPPRPGL